MFKLKARWRLIRYVRELRKLAHKIDAHQKVCYKFREKHHLDRDSVHKQFILAPPDSATMDIMLAMDKEMCAKHDALIDTIRVFRKEHNI